MSLDAQARALLEAARPAFDPRAEDAARNEAALLALVGAGAAVKASAAGTVAGVLGKAARTLKVGLLGGGAKASAGVLVVLAVGGAAAWRASSAPSTSAEVHAAAPSVLSGSATAIVRPRVAPSTTSTDAPPRASANAPVDRTIPLPTAQTTSRAEGRKSPAQAPVDDPTASAPRVVSSSSSDLGVEVALVRKGLAARDPAAALEALDEHARRFPQGALEEERAAARVRTLCALGRVAEAKADAARFIAVHPTSPHVDAVRAACTR